jgi:tRNA pseudouridine55 synthase
MSRRKRGRNIHGVVLLDKPAGLTSNRALQKVRGMFDARKAGHTGSLDPFATGMLPICLGEASKTAGYLLDAVKTYRATALFGESTNTADTEGEVTATAALPDADANAMDTAMDAFRGDILQVPPMYSALKRDGKPLYKLARQGIEVERLPRPVTIHSLHLLRWTPPLLDFEVVCSKGTYIRTLAEDLAKSMGSCAHLVALRRLAIDAFGKGPMVTLEELGQALDEDRLDQSLLAVDAGLPDWPLVTLDVVSMDRFCHGNPVATGLTANPHVRVYSCENRLLGLGSVLEDGQLQPRRVFNID